jgi:5-carboxymethyl-2-hydroxymuconate isomerase
MPHITVEHSSNVSEACDIQSLVDAIHTSAAGHPLTSLFGLRTRAAERVHYRVADGDPRYAFVAVTARIGPGRDAGTRHDFLGLLLDTVEEFVTTHAPNVVVAFSAEVQEIDNPRENRNHIRAHLDARSE